MNARHRLGTGLVVALVFATATAGAAAVDRSTVTARYPAYAVGSDVSYPQCNPDEIGAVKTPATGKFGIVGLTKGKPYSYSDCGLSEWMNANTLQNPPEIYINTANPAPSSKFYWPTSGAHDPVLCRNASSVADPGCAYDYGWHAAEDALTTAVGKGITEAKSETWWLDVETDNTWSGLGKGKTPSTAKRQANAADLQGAVDYLRGQGVPAVGIYTSAAEWKSVTGGYDKVTAPTYAKAWKAEFTPSYPLSTSPGWQLGIGRKSSASAACNTLSPLGTANWLAQYAGPIDQDLACANLATSTVKLTTSTGHIRAARGSKAKIQVTITETGATQPVHLTLKKPTGIKARFGTTTVTKSSTVTLTITPRRAATTGLHHLTITATGLTVVRSKTLKINVKSA